MQNEAWILFGLSLPRRNVLRRSLCKVVYSMPAVRWNRKRSNRIEKWRIKSIPVDSESNRIDLIKIHGASLTTCWSEDLRQNRSFRCISKREKSCSIESQKTDSNWKGMYRIDFSRCRIYSDRVWTILVSRKLSVRSSLNFTELILSPTNVFSCHVLHLWSCWLNRRSCFGRGRNVVLWEEFRFA